jgi:hypothetical protein
MGDRPSSLAAELSDTPLMASFMCCMLVRPALMLEAFT